MTRPLKEEMAARFRFLLGVTRSEDIGKGIARFVAFLVGFFGPLLAFLEVGPHFVLLDERIYYRLAYGLLACTALSFAVGPLNRMFRPYSVGVSVLARFGFSIPVVSGLFTAALLVNSMGQPSVRVRDLACLAKRATYGRQRIYYVRVRPWEGSDRAVEVSVPPAVFAGTCPGGDVRITTATGPLGVEWIQQIGVLPLPSGSRP